MPTIRSTARHIATKAGRMGCSHIGGPPLTRYYTNPAYSTTETMQWRYGLDSDTGTTYLGNSGSGSVQWSAWTGAFPMKPGTYTVSEFRVTIGSASASNCDAALFVVYDVVGTDLVERARVDIFDQLTLTDTSTPNTITIDDLEIVIEEGDTVAYGVALRGPVTRASNTPGVRFRNPCATTPTRRYTGTAGVSTLPTTFAYITSASGVQICMGLTFRSSVRTIWEYTPSVNETILVPIQDTGATKAQYTKVATLTADAASDRSLIWEQYDDTALETFKLDFVAAADDAIYNGQTVSGIGSATEQFDLLFMHDDTNDSHNVCILNRTTGQGPEGAGDFTTISHAAETNAARNTFYASPPAYKKLQIAGTGSIGAIQVGWEPVVIFGDSMASFSSSRVGAYLPADFTYPRMSWRADISGNRLTLSSAGLHTAGYLRYQSVTPGVGDLCELRNVLFCFAMYGLNDISRISTSDAQIPIVTDDYFARIGVIIDDLQANGNEVLLMGLAPYHFAANASAQEAATIQAWNDQYADVAEAQQVAYLNPWTDLVDPDTIGDAIPQILAAYTSDDGTHINATGAQVVCPLAAESYESGIVGGAWASSLGRLRNP